MSQSFSTLGLTVTSHLAAALKKEAIDAPTAVQSKAISLLLAQRQVAMRSGTGTGKTLAYVLPLLQRAATEATFRAVIMAPSPELALQILRTVEACKEPHVTCLGLTGSGNQQRQRERLKKHPQVLVGTPGRVLELLWSKKIKAAQVQALVLDEVDEILAEENDSMLRELCSRPECRPQIVCVSATFGAKATGFMHTCMATDRVHVDVEDAPQAGRIRHLAVAYSQQRKDVALMRLLASHGIDRAMLFVNKIAHVGHLFRLLTEARMFVVTISGERHKWDRERAMRALRGTGACILVATDAAARGLDIKGLDWVVHYEMARDVPTYLHRTGRTARAGRRGTSLAMVAADEQFLVRRCEKELGITFER